MEHPEKELRPVWFELVSRGAALNVVATRICIDVWTGAVRSGAVVCLAFLAP